MNENRENGMGCIAIIAWICLISIIYMACSCTTTKLRTEFITVHDTLRVSHTDTIRDVKVVQVTDTVKQKEVHTITINNVGDTIKEEHHYHDTEKVFVVDSTNRYKASRDSLSKALHEEKEKVKVIQDNLALIKQKILFVIILIAIMYFIVKIVFRKNAIKK